MSIAFEPNLYVRIVELNDGPAPLPLENGFNTARAYRVLGLYTPSETGEAYLILANDREEMWFISNRHVRVKGVFSETKLHIDHKTEAIGVKRTAGVDRADFFLIQQRRNRSLIKMWTEDRFMLEIMTPEMTARYVKVLSPEFLNQTFGLCIPTNEQPANSLNLIG